MKRWRRRMCAGTLIALVWMGSSVTHAVVIFNGQNRPTSISNLSIGGIDYNVAIDYGGSFDSHYGSFSAPTPVPAFWNSMPAAVSAVQALAETLNAAGSLPSENTMLFVPESSGTWFLGDYVDGVIAEFSVGGAQYSHSTAASGIRVDPHLPGTFGWPTFTVVPEPSTAILLGFGCAAILLWRRARQTKISH